MRITGPSIPTVEQRPADKSSAAAGQDTSAAGAVVVDARARETAEATQRPSAEHAAKLESIAAALSDGTYKVDYDVLASAILADEAARTGGGDGR